MPDEHNPMAIAMMMASDAVWAMIQNENTSKIVRPTSLAKRLTEDSDLKGKEYESLKNKVMDILEQFSEYLKDAANNPKREDTTEALFHLHRNGEEDIRKVRMKRAYKEFTADQLLIAPEGKSDIRLTPIEDGHFEIEFKVKGGQLQRHEVR